MSEVFLFTDESTVELSFHNSTSSSQNIFNLVLILKKLEMAHGVTFNIIHVDGTRMIDKGTDGISRGNIL